MPCLCHPNSLGDSGTLREGVVVVSSCKWLKDRAGSSSSSSSLMLLGGQYQVLECALVSQKAVLSGFGF